MTGTKSPRADICGSVSRAKYFGLGWASRRTGLMALAGTSPTR